MEWSDWIALGSAAVALVSLGFSLWGYFVYDRPIKKLQKQDLEQEALKKKQAILKVDYLEETGNSMLRIANVGYANAENITLRSLSEGYVFYNRDSTKEHFIGILRPQDTPQRIHLVYRKPHLTMEVKWDDASKKGNIEKYELNCNARS